ncbi:MAG: ISNCY family transposase [Gemmatimonadota bacterium]
MLEMSWKEVDRLGVLRQVEEEGLTVAAASERLGLTPRHVRRLLRRLEREGEAGLVHRGRGRPSNHRKPEALRARVLERVREEDFHDFAPTLLAEHLSRDPEIGPLSAHTLRRWMIEAGLWSRARRRARHRRRRTRRAAFGELVQMDTSIHPWLEDRCSESIVLVAMVDDATSRLFARFFGNDTGAANRLLLLDYLTRFGRPRALYADRAGHFRGHWRARERKLRDLETLSLIQRALAALEVELITAYSPQAKGRIERTFGTLQDRLLKEMRLARVASLAEANRFLEEVFLPRCWTPRFTVQPCEPTDAHRPLPRGTDLHRLFAEEEERMVRNDFTLRYKNQLYQIERTEARDLKPKDRITIEQRLDGSLRFRHGERYLSPTPLGPWSLRLRVDPEPRPKKKLKPPPPRPVPDDHPWRRFPVRVGKGRFLPPRRPTPLPSTNGDHAP